MTLLLSIPALRSLAPRSVPWGGALGLLVGLALLPGCAPVTGAAKPSPGPLGSSTASTAPVAAASTPSAAPARPVTPVAAATAPRAVAAAALRPALAPASAPLPAVLAYRDLLKLINEGRGNPAAVRARLLGRTLQVHVLVTGPRSLMAVREDRVYFICRQRPPSFKGGPVQAEVVAYDEALKGDPMVTLSRCPP